MLRIDGKELVITKDKVELLRRPMLLGHSCPNCKAVIHGLVSVPMVDGELVEVPANLRKEKDEPWEINLRAVSEGSPGYAVEPEYESVVLQLESGAKGQYFYDKLHFGGNCSRVYGRCKYTQAIYVTKNNPTTVAIRALAALRNTYVGINEVQWKEAQAILAREPSVAENVAAAFRAKALQVEDALGTERFVLLLSKEEWSTFEYTALNASIKKQAEALAPTEPEVEEIEESADVEI